MSEGDSISRLLDALQAGDPSAAAAICAHFDERARKVAKQRISPQIQARVGVSDIVQEALKSALSLVRQGGLRHNRREEFEAILVTLIKRKAASAARKAAPQQQMPADAPTILTDKGRTPEEEAMQNESEALAGQAIGEMTEFLFQQHEAMKSKHHAVRGLVRVLGIIHGLDTEEIRKLLRDLYPDGEPPAKRTVQLAVEEGWEMLKKEFRGDSRAAD